MHELCANQRRILANLKRTSVNHVEQLKNERTIMARVVVGREPPLSRSSDTSRKLVQLETCTLRVQV